MHLIGEPAKKEEEVGSVIKWRVLKNYETCYSTHSRGPLKSQWQKPNKIHINNIIDKWQKIKKVWKF